MPFWTRLRHWLRARTAPRPHIEAGLWLTTVQHHPFLAALGLEEQARLRALCAEFLHRKEFHGAHGLAVTDAMALAIAAQACLPLLHWGPPAQALAWYEDFVGIVVHPAQAVARRQFTDGAGVVHQQDEVLAGEAMDGGPVMLSWPDVASAPEDAAQGVNLVIHEFAHKLDLRNGEADGFPPLPSGFLGLDSASAARRLWRDRWTTAYQDFREAVIRHERFGAPAPWLDGYGATAPSEFFAVACEAYWVQRARFAQEFPTLLPLLDGFFRPAPPRGEGQAQASAASKAV